jgi:sulfatase maturation enzyme AslB (radical SAM superfamily)
VLKRWFWRAQISILCACPPLHGVVVRHGIGSNRSGKLWIVTLLRLALRAIPALFSYCRDKLKKRVVLPRVSVGITTRCTLNCDKCVGHIADLQTHEDFPLDVLLRDIKALLSHVDYIYAFNLSGGETFLHPELDQIIRFCAASNRIGTIDLSTNGTLIPNQATLSALRDAKATVRISRYAPALQPNVEQLKTILKENGIHYLHESGDYWYDTGDLGRLQEGSAKRRFSICAQRLCPTCYQGNLYLCSPSLVLTEKEGAGGSEDSIAVRAVSAAEFRRQWKELHKKHVITTCSYCQGFSYQTPRVPVAEQRERHAAD